MFYAQSGVLFGYLYHAGASQREALMRFLCDTYTGKTTVDAGATERYLNLSAEDLGQRARAWARQVLDGAVRPEGTLHVVGAAGR